MLRGKGIITPIQREILNIISGLPDQEQFYLTGGTALAEFYLGHRLSFDLDFFTKEEKLIMSFSYLLEKAPSQKEFQISITRRFATFVEFIFKKGEEATRVDLALDAPFCFEPPILSEYGVLVNGYKDLIIDKVLAYYGRFEPRDAVDLFFILQKENFNNLFSLAAKKDQGFDLYWFAVALKRADEFPDELGRWPVKMLIPFEVTKLKDLFRETTTQILSRILERSG